MTKVITFGVFDYFHYGHLRLLERCRELGDHLTVAVQVDAEIHRTKPQAQILYNEQQRVAMVSAIKGVDEVVLYRQIDTDLPHFDFDVLVVGGDQTHAGFQRAIADCERLGKRVVRLERTPNISSSQIKANIT